MLEGTIVDMSRDVWRCEKFVKAWLRSVESFREFWMCSESQRVSLNLLGFPTMPFFLAEPLCACPKLFSVVLKEFLTGWAMSENNYWLLYL